MIENDFILLIANDYAPKFACAEIFEIRDCVLNI